MFFFILLNIFCLKCTNRLQYLSLCFRGSMSLQNVSFKYYFSKEILQRDLCLVIILLDSPVQNPSPTWLSWASFVLFFIFLVIAFTIPGKVVLSSFNTFLLYAIAIYGLLRSSQFDARVDFSLQRETCFLSILRETGSKCYEMFVSHCNCHCNCHCRSAVSKHFIENVLNLFPVT